MPIAITSAVSAPALLMMVLLALMVMAAGWYCYQRLILEADSGTRKAGWGARAGSEAQFLPVYPHVLPMPAPTVRADRTPERGPEWAVPASEPTPSQPPARSRARFERTPDMTAEWLIEMAEDTVDERGAPMPLIERPIEEHALRLLNFIRHRGADWVPDINRPSLARQQRRGKRRKRDNFARGMFSYEAKNTYLNMCAYVEWWRPHRWEGTGGVAEHLRRLLGHKRGSKLPYADTLVEGGERHKLAFLPMPERTPVVGGRGYRKGGKRTPPQTPTPPNVTPITAAAGRIRRAA